MSKSASLGEAVLKFTVDDSRLKKDTSKAKLNVEKTLSVVGSGMKAVSVGILAAGTAVAAIGAGIFAMATKAAAGADEILKMASTYSLTTDKIQELKYAAELVDVPLETMVGSFSRMTMSMGAAKTEGSETRQIFDELQVSIFGADGQLRSTNDVWLDTIDALGKVGNQAERDRMSLALFGRSAADLNPLIVAGAAALQQFGLEAHNSGAVVDEELLVSAAKLDDALERVKSTVGSLLIKLGAQFAPGVEEVVTLVSGYITQFSNIIGDSGLSTEEKLQAASTLIAKILMKIRDGLPELIKSGTEILKSLIQGIVMAIPVLIPAVIDVVLSLVDFLIQMLPMILEGGIKIVVGLAEGIGEGLPKLIPAIVQLVLDLVQIIYDNFDKIIEAGLQLVIELVDGIIDAIPLLIKAMPKLITAMVDATIDALPLIIGAGVELILMLLAGIIGSIPLLLEAVPDILDALVKEFSSPEFRKGLAKAGAEIVNGVFEGLKDEWSYFIENFGAMIDSIWENTKENWANFVNKFIENVKALVAAIEELLGINSPSTVFAGIGDHLMSGLAVGIERSAGVPAAASSQAMNRVTESTVTQYYYLTGQYQYQSETTLMDQVKMLQLLGGA